MSSKIKSDKVSFKASDTAKPPTPKAVSNGVIDIPNDCNITKIPTDTITILARLTKIVVEGRFVPCFSAQKFNNPTPTFEAAKVTDRIKMETIILLTYSW